MACKLRSDFLLFFVSLILVSCSGSKTAVKQDAFDKGKADIIIAILPFNNNSPDKSLDSAGVTLADLISAQMSSRKGFKLVERQRIDDILKEMKLGQTGMIDQNTALQIGRMLGANVMAFGSFSVLGKKALLTLRLVKAETGEIVGGAAERADDIANLDLMAENAAKKLSDSLAIK